MKIEGEPFLIVGSIGENLRSLRHGGDKQTPYAVR